MVIGIFIMMAKAMCSQEYNIKLNHFVYIKYAHSIASSHQLKMGQTNEQKNTYHISFIFSTFVIPLRYTFCMF